MTISQWPARKNENLLLLMFFLILEIRKKESKVFGRKEQVLRKKLVRGNKKLKSKNWKEDEKIFKQKY